MESEEGERGEGRERGVFGREGGREERERGLREGGVCSTGGGEGEEGLLGVGTVDVFLKTKGQRQ